MNKYKLYEKIGDGTYGTVYKGINIETNEKVAIKKLKTKLKSWQECMDLKEVKALSKLKSHNNIIKLKEVVRESNSDVFLIFEYAECNLYQYIEKIKKSGSFLSENKIKSIIHQIVSGLSYTHLNGFFHRDLKPENILLTNDETVKLADFGLAKELPTYYTNGNFTDYVCTRWYRAPECILRSSSYTSSIDIWSVGTIMAELYMRKPIFPGLSEIDQLIKVVDILGTPKFNDWPEGYKLIHKKGMKFPSSNGEILSSIIPGAGVEAINLMTEILQWDPMKRPICGKILSHSFFDEMKGKTLLTNKTSYYDSYTNDYMNNFNYNTYRNNNNFIPLLNTNYSNPYNNQKFNKQSRLSNFVENNMKFNNANYDLSAFDNHINKKIFKQENNLFSKNGFFDSYPYLQIYK